MPNSKRKLLRFTVFTWLALGVCVVSVATFALYVRAEKQISRANELRQQSFLLADELRQSSDDLTRMVRTYVATGDAIYKQHYQEILDIRDGRKPRPADYQNVYWDLVMPDDVRPHPRKEAMPLLTRMRQAGFADEEFSRLAAAKANSDALTQTELAAMKLIESPGPATPANRQKAIGLLHDLAYHQAKNGIMGPIGEVSEMVDRRTADVVHAAENYAMAVRLVLIALGMVLVFQVWVARKNLYGVLGGSLHEVYSGIAHLGCEDCSSVIPVARGMEDSILGRVAETQVELARLDSERKQAAVALLESDERWKFALEGAGDGVWDWNIQTGVAFYSRRYKEMLGFAEDEIGDTADEWTRRIHPDDAPGVMSALQPYMEGKPGSVTVEFRMLRKDGSWQWTQGRGMVISRDSDGKPLRMIGTNTDITERRQAEEALRESELRFSLFMEYLPACAYIKDAQGRHTFANAALASQTEATAGPLLGKANGDLWPKEIAAKLDSADAAVIASRSPLTVEEDVLMNNAVRTYRTTKFPIERSNGETFLAGISFDITEHKQAEAELIQRERDIQSILNNMPSMIGYWDRNLLNRFGNHAYHTWFGIDEREMVGKHIREVIGEERYRLNLPYIEAALRGERQVFERDIPVPDGVGNRNALATYIPDYYEGEVRGFYVLVADVTPLKQAQAELEKYRNHLEELVADRTSELAQSRDAAEAGNRAKTIFLANMSHELHTPMNGVMGMIDLALRRAADPKQIDWLNKSKVAAQRLANVINDIIDFSKAEAERLPLDEKNFSLSRMIDDAMAMENLAAEAKGLRLTREIPATFPDLLSGDAFRVRQILLNFLGNACKFSDQGTITVRVSAAEQDGDSVLARIEVEDQGIGISPEQQATLFQAFTQVDGSMTRKYGGSGLGLVISKRLASLMGGDAGVVAQEGSGCTFWATVRLKSAKVGEVVI